MVGERGADIETHTLQQSLVPERDTQTQTQSHTYTQRTWLESERDALKAAQRPLFQRERGTFTDKHAHTDMPRDLGWRNTRS